MTVVPGGEAAVDVRIANTGTVVDSFTVTVVGAAAGWATVEPAAVSLFPGADQTVRVVLRPPRSAEVAAGDVPFGVRVTSREDPGGSVTEEGVVTVAPFALVALELTPRTSRGSRRMVHDVAVTNDGNQPAEVTLQAADPDRALAFVVDPPAVSVAPGTASFARVKVRPAKTFGSGPPITHLFQVVATAGGPGDEPVAAADGMVVQEATRPPWLKRAIVWSLLGLLLLAALWFALLKPTVRSAAKEAALEATAPPTIGPGGGGSSSGSDDAASSSAAAAGTATTGTGTSTPIDGRLFLTDKGSTDFTVPDGASLQLTDIVLQNPAGNTGTLRIQRGDTALLVVELGNFRDLDYHFVAPIVFAGGQKLVLAAECTSPGCTPGAYFAGFLVRG